MSRRDRFQHPPKDHEVRKTEPIQPLHASAIVIITVQKKYSTKVHSRSEPKITPGISQIPSDSKSDSDSESEPEQQVEHPTFPSAPY